MSKDYSIWIEAEEWAEGQWDIYDDNTDVIVTFDDNSKWVASFYTYKNIFTLSKKNQQTGECLHGKYYWGSDMILIDESSRNRIEEVIRHLINNGEFKHIFRKCDEVGFGELIKTIKSPSNSYKAEIDKYKDGSYEVSIYVWKNQRQFWKVLTRQKISSEQNAIEIAFQKLSECSGEKIENI